MFLNDCAGLSVNGWLYRGLMTPSEISVVVQLSNKISYAMVIESIRKGMMKSLLIFFINLTFLSDCIVN